MQIILSNTRTPKGSQLRGDGGWYHKRESVSETSSPSEENSTTLNPVSGLQGKFHLSFDLQIIHVGRRTKETWKISSHRRILHKRNISVQEVHYSNDDVLVKERYFLGHKVKLPIFYHKCLKLSTLSLHSRHRQKKLPFWDLISSATDYLS